MALVSLNPKDAVPLTDQIVAALSRRIEERAIRSGTRMPSIRKFAADHRVSRFTVVQAYDRLVATGHLSSRPGSGFYVAPRPALRSPEGREYSLERAMDVLWLLRSALQGQEGRFMPGAGWLPGTWMDEAGIQRSLRALSRKQGGFLTGYGEPGGYLPLRQLLQRRLGEIGVAADPAQILLTKGATHALDLIARYFLRPGDAVLVDDPGYVILFGALKSLGAKIIGVPWNLDGPDPAVMESLAREHRPKLFFTNSVLHNPTGASVSVAVAHRLLQVAENYDLLIVEDDVYGDFHPSPAARLATLDQLDRVIYVNSFSKTVSASLRVGYLACSRPLAEDLADVKLLAGLTTSEIGERLLFQLLTDGYYRKYLDRLRGRLGAAREETVRRLEQIGFEVCMEPPGGMFLWARREAQGDSAAMAADAASHGIVLAPGKLFRPQQEPSPWLRFNVAACDQAVLEFLEGYGGKDG